MKKPVGRELKNGWTVRNSSIYSFEHIPTTQAEALQKQGEELHVVETINWTFAEGNQQKVHRNKYFAMGIQEASALAVQIAIESIQVAENVIAIRTATSEEVDHYWAVEEHLSTDPAAIER